MYIAAREKEREEHEKSGYFQTVPRIVPIFYFAEHRKAQKMLYGILRKRFVFFCQ